MLEYGEELTRKTRLAQAPMLQWGDRLTLESWSRRPEFPASLKRWAKVILSCAEGKTNAAVAREVGIAQLTVGKWRRQFIAAQCVNGSQDSVR
jgi:transposase-like protein